jgi:hypothetical protein
MLLYCDDVVLIDTDSNFMGQIISSSVLTT